MKEVCLQYEFKKRKICNISLTVWWIFMNSLYQPVRDVRSHSCCGCIWSTCRSCPSRQSTACNTNTDTQVSNRTISHCARSHFCNSRSNITTLKDEKRLPIVDSPRLSMPILAELLPEWTVKTKGIFVSLGTEWPTHTSVIITCTTISRPSMHTTTSSQIQCADRYLIRQSVETCQFRYLLCNPKKHAKKIRCASQ